MFATVFAQGWIVLKRSSRGGAVWASAPHRPNQFLLERVNKKLACRLFPDYKTPLSTRRRHRPECLGSSMVEQLTLNQLVVGSSPTRGTSFLFGILSVFFLFPKF